MSSILLRNIHCVRSTFAANFKYLSYKYNISQDEWFTDLSHLIKKVDIKFRKDLQIQSTVNAGAYAGFLRGGNVTISGILDINAAKRHVASSEAARL